LKVDFDTSFPGDTGNKFVCIHARKWNEVSTKLVKLYYLTW